MELSDFVRETVVRQNVSRTKKLPWSIKPVEDGFFHIEGGAFGGIEGGVDKIYPAGKNRLLRFSGVGKIPRPFRLG